MKTSNIKTAYSPEDVARFLKTKQHANPETIEQLTEGHVSQAIGFETSDGNRLVLRISTKDDDFKADQYAFEHFGTRLPVPRVLEIGSFTESAYFCITERARGVISDKMPAQAIKEALPAIHAVFAKLFNVDVSNMTGYGPLDLATGNAEFESWNARLLSHVNGLDVETYKEHARNINLDVMLVNSFMEQFKKHLPYASEVRRLLHGDLGFDNLLIDVAEVTAVIDWAHVGYGDWVHDFAKFDFWWPGRFGDAKEFAEKHSMDARNIEERMALYWAITALETIRSADRFKSEGIAEWLREHVKEKTL